MEKYTCWKCDGRFTVNNPNWGSTYCPHCGVRVFNPDKIEYAGNKAAIAIVQIILGAILIGVALSTMG